MGKYINITTKGERLSTHHKASDLIQDGAVTVPEPKSWLPNLICVVEMAYFKLLLTVKMRKSLSALEMMVATGPKFG